MPDMQTGGITMNRLVIPPCIKCGSAKVNPKFQTCSYGPIDVCAMPDEIRTAFESKGHTEPHVCFCGPCSTRIVELEAKLHSVTQEFESEYAEHCKTLDSAEAAADHIEQQTNAIHVATSEIKTLQEIVDLYGGQRDKLAGQLATAHEIIGKSEGRIREANRIINDLLSRLEMCNNDRTELADRPCIACVSVLNDNAAKANSIKAAIFTIDSFEGQEITYSIAMALAQLRKQLVMAI